MYGMFFKIVLKDERTALNDGKFVYNCRLNFAINVYRITIENTLFEIESELDRSIQFQTVISMKFI